MELRVGSKSWSLSVPENQFFLGYRSVTTQNTTDIQIPHGKGRDWS